MAASLRETIPLHRNKIVKKVIGGTLLLALMFSILSVMFLAFVYGALDDMLHDAQWLGGLQTALAVGWVVIIVACIGANCVYQDYYFKTYFYDADDRNIMIRKGVIARKEIILRVTDVYVDQDILDVIFGLYDVHISTPTESSGLFAHIDGVTKAGADELRALLLERINRSDA